MADPRNRRPIASRNAAWARGLARWLAATSVSPNAISMASVAFAALAGAAFWLSGGAEGWVRAVWLILAALGCQLRLVCNLMDGLVAVEGGKGAPDGPFWNEAPDRAADILILVGLGLGASAPALGWAAATAAVLTSYVRELGAAQGLGQDFAGPMAKPQRMAAVTAAALVAVPLPVVAGWPVPVLALWLVCLGAFATAARRSLRLIAGLNAR